MNEAPAQPSVSTDVDFSICVIGYTPSSPVSAGQVSPAYDVPAAAASDLGGSDAVDCLTQAITTTLANPAPVPASIYSTPATTPGGYGTINVDRVVGTAVVTNDTGTPPKGTYQPWMQMIVGGLIGVDDDKAAYASLDNGRTKKVVKLGASLTYDFPASDGWGITGRAGFAFAPSTTNAAYVTLAVELRADTLAHLANVTAHDAADTSAAQVALAASSVPATVSASTAVVNLVLAALVSHVTNITAHDGPDLVARTALVALSAATNTKTGIDLAIALKSIINTHEGTSLSASTAGLMGATASIASPQTYTAASNFLAGGVAAMDAQPRQVKITISGSGTPANMADSVTITGFDYANNVQTETALDLTGLGTVISTKAWKGTGLALAYVAADGTAASFQTGYSNGVHNSADSTNTITSPDPSYGTLLANDLFFTATKPPRFAASDLYSAGPPATGAFAAIAESSQQFGVLVITEPIVDPDYDGVSSTGTVYSTLVAGLNYGLSLGKRWHLVTRFRDPMTGETDAAYILAFQKFRDANHDSRIECIAGSLLVTDAFTGQRFLRSFLAPYLARINSFRAVAGEQGERLAQNPGWVGRGVLDGASLKDDAGAIIGHDEAIRSGIESAANAPVGSGGCCYYLRIAERAGTYVTNRVSVMYGVGSEILSPMDRRVANALERTAVALSLDSIGGADIYDPQTLVLDQDIRDALSSKIAQEIKANYGREFQNAEDPNLVVINETVTKSGDRVTIYGTLNVLFYGYTDTVALTFKATR